MRRTGLRAAVRCLAAVRRNGSVYGDDFASEIASELGSVGSIGYGELFCPTDVAGVSDIDTILLNTKSTDGEQEMSEFAAAMVLVHEYEHVQHRRGSGGGQEDPLTNDPLCGPCNHALMHFEQANLIAAIVCAYPGTDSSEPCEVIEMNLTAGHSAASCQADGCNSDWCPSGYAAQLASRTTASAAFEDCCGR